MHVLNTNEGRKEVKSLKSKCVKCEKQKGKLQINTQGNEKKIEDKPKADRKQEEKNPSNRQQIGILTR